MIEMPDFSAALFVLMVLCLAGALFCAWIVIHLQNKKIELQDEKIKILERQNAQMREGLKKE